MQGQNENDPFFGRMTDPTGGAFVRGPCGDEMEFYLSIRDDVVEDVKYHTDGCGTILKVDDFAKVTVLTGASENNYNLTVYYEDNVVSARLSYIYRDNYITRALGPDELGLEQQSYGTLDGSLTLNIGDNATMFLQASNLTDEADVELTRIGGLPSAYEDNGRRYLLGVRFNF